MECAQVTENKDYGKDYLYGKDYGPRPKYRKQSTTHQRLAELSSQSLPDRLYR